MPLPVENASLDELESLSAEITSQEDERARPAVRELLYEPLGVQLEEAVSDRRLTR